METRDDHQEQKSKRVPPSRFRYEKSNPTISVRVSQEIKEELEELKITTGFSMSDILKVGLDKMKPDAEASYERGLSDGYEMGYQGGKEQFEVMATCWGCRKAHVPVVGETMKAVAAQKLIGWCPKSCR